MFCLYFIRNFLLVGDSITRRRLPSIENPITTMRRCETVYLYHYDDVIMGAIASQFTSLTIVYSIVYSDADQRKHQSSASLAFVWVIHRGPVNSPHKWPVTRKMFPFDDVIMIMKIPMPVHTGKTTSLYILNQPSVWYRGSTQFPLLLMCCPRCFAFGNAVVFMGIVWVISGCCPSEFKHLFVSLRCFFDI